LNRNVRIAILALLVVRDRAAYWRLGWRAGNMDGEIADVSLQKTATTAGRVRGAAVSQKASQLEQMDGGAVDDRRRDWTRF
jgi:hypothetical protein